MSFGKRIKYLREKNGLTQEDVAYILHISRQSVSKWEQDKSLPQVYIIKELVKIFKCKYEDILAENNVE